jgi:hypothetical protein
VHKKRITGLVIFIIGIALVIFSLIVKSRMSTAEGEIGHITHSPFGQSKATNMVGGVLEGKVGEYQPLFIWSLVGGIVLAVLGGGMLICCRSKKRR